jgi:hypothetical protein
MSVTSDVPPFPCELSSTYLYRMLVQVLSRYVKCIYVHHTHLLTYIVSHLCAREINNNCLQKRKQTVLFILAMNILNERTICNKLYTFNMKHNKDLNFVNHERLVQEG